MFARYILLVFLVLSREVFCVGAVAADDQNIKDENTRIAEDVFASDLREPIGPDFPYGVKHIVYIDINSLPDVVKNVLNQVQTGISRRKVTGLMWENGGVSANEFIVQHPLVLNKVVALRITFRPAAMPVQTFEDSDKRLRWLAENKPNRAPNDIAMQVSKPFLSSIYID